MNAGNTSMNPATSSSNPAPPFAHTSHQLELAISAGKIGLWHWDIQQDVLSWSKEQEAIYGLEEGHFGGTLKDFLQFLHPDDLARLDQKKAEQAFSQNLDYVDEFRIIRKDGKIRWVQSRQRRIIDDQGETVAITGVNIDVTDQKGTWDSLDYQKKILETVTDNTDMALFLMDHKQYCTYMNEAAEKMTGFTLEELKGKQLHYYVHHTHPDGRHYPLEDCPIDQALPERRRTKGEEVFVHKDGHFFTVAFTASPIIVEGKPIGTVLEVRDTTEERKNAESLRRTQELLSSTFAGIDAALSIVEVTDGGADFRFLTVNPKAARLSGLSMEQWAGRTVREMFSVEDAHAIISHYQQAIREERSVSYEELLEFPTGKIWAFTTVSPLRNEVGKIIRLVTTSIDITEKKKAEEAVKAGEERIRNFISKAPVAMGLYRGASMVVELANEAMLQFWGREAGDVMGKPVFDAIPEARGQGFEEILEKVYKTGERFAAHGVSVVLRTNGKPSKRYVDLVYEGYRETDGSISGVVEVVSDVTEQYLVAEELRESEERFRSTFQNAAVGIAHVGLDGKWLLVNNRLLEILGYPNEQLLQMSFQELTHPDDLQADLEKAQALVAGRINTYTIEKRYRRIDGVYVWASLTVSLMRYADGSPRNYVSIIQDITKRKLAEQALMESEERFRTIADVTPNMVWSLHPDGSTRYVNKYTSEYFGLSAEEFPGDWSHFVHADDLPALRNVMVNAIAGRRNYRTEFRLRRRDGVYRHFIANGAPAVLRDGSLYGYIGTTVDITDIREAEEKVRESEQQFRSVIEQAPVGTCLFVGEELRIAIANERMIEYLGKGPGIIGMTLEEALPEMQNQPFPEILKGIFKNGETVSASAVPAYIQTGSEQVLKYFDYTFKPLTNEKGETYAIIDMAKEVTEDVRARKQLEESELQFRTLAENLPQMIWITDAKGTPLYFSSRWLEYSGQENVGKAWEWMLHQEDLDRIMDMWSNRRDNEGAFRYEVRLRNHQGQYRWHYAIAETIRDQQGNILRWIGALTDIHDQKTLSEVLERLVEERTRDLVQSQQQLAILNRQLDEQNKELQRSNEDLQQFAHVASHDLKEPVRKVLIFANRLRDEYADQLPGKAVDFIQKIDAATRRMYSMIDGVLLYSSIGSTEGEFEEVDLNSLLRDIENDLEVAIQQKEAEITLAEFPAIDGIQVLLYQLFYNLINNSLKFSRPGVAARINIRAERYEQQGQDFLTLVIEDNGIGFDQSQARYIFQTFSRLHTKDKFEGTGLGLALCQKIVERHRGFISASGEEGVGAVFRVHLPMRQ